MKNLGKQLVEIYYTKKFKGKVGKSLVSDLIERVVWQDDQNELFIKYKGGLIKVVNCGDHFKGNLN